MKSNEYWERRSGEQLLNLLKDGDKILSNLKEDYESAISNINKEVQILYGRFAKDNKIDINKARELIKGNEYKRFRMSIDRYIEEIENGNSALALELNVLLMKNRVNRLEVLEAEIIANSALIAKAQEKYIERHLKDVFEDTYYKSMYDKYKDKDQKILELMERHHVALNKDTIKKVLTIPWSGANYSENIWKREYNVAHKIKTLVTRNIIEGKSIENLTKTVTEELGKDYKHAARTLIHTETAFVKAQADLEVYKNLGVKEYEFLATLDNKTSDVCRRLDKKHFGVDEAMPGKNYPPMHPRCRSITIAYRKNQEGKSRSARDKEGKSYNVALDMDYNEWRAEYSGVKAKKSNANFKKREYNKSEQRFFKLMNATSRKEEKFKILSKFYLEEYDILVDEELINMDFKAIEESFKGINSFISEFAELSSSLDYIGYDSNGVMSCDGRSIYFNPKWYSNYENLEKLCKSQSDSGFWVKDSNIESNAIHECAHGLEWILTKRNNNYSSGAEIYNAFNEGIEANAIVKSALKDVKNNGLYKNLDNDEIVSKISRYASEDSSGSEIMAEAFVDVFLHGNDAEEISKYIKELAKKRYFELYGGAE